MNTNNPVKSFRLPFFFAFIIIFTVIFSLQTSLANTSQELSAGGVFFVSQRPQVSAGQQENLVPFIGYEDEFFYIRGLEAGYKWKKRENTELNLIGSIRLQTLSEDDSDELDGINSRRQTGEAGALIDHRIGLIQIQSYLIHDIFNRHGGFEAGGSLSSRIPAPGGWIFGTLGMRYQDSSLVSHYFGVDNNEANAGDLEPYSPSGEFSWSLGTGWMSGDLDPLYLQLQATYHRLGSESRSSPITEENSSTTGMLIVGYTIQN